MHFYLQEENCLKHIKRNRYRYRSYGTYLRGFKAAHASKAQEHHRSHRPPVKPLYAFVALWPIFLHLTREQSRGPTGKIGGLGWPGRQRPSTKAFNNAGSNSPNVLTIIPLASWNLSPWWRNILQSSVIFVPRDRWCREDRQARPGRLMSPSTSFK